jgi:ABC-2 type transport system ATP-binding protein
MPAIEIIGLTKDFEVGFLNSGKTRALDNLDLTVEENEIFGFLGPNGAGKTTTLKLLMCLLRPTAGSARILGEPIENVSIHKRIGYLPEQAYFYDYLTAREMVTYFSQLSGARPSDARSLANEALERVSLPEKAWDRHLRKFSKGMLQRVGLAQAIVHAPEVVFLDEPMSGLDPIGRRQVRDLIISLREGGATVFFSSHILADVEALCDRVAILSGGSLVETGPLDSIRASWSGELEIVATSANADAPARLAAWGYSVKITPGGLHIHIDTEADLDAALARLREVNARVVSVMPKRSSLEELFLREVGSAVHDEAR